jgi:hypothetical protein
MNAAPPLPPPPHEDHCMTMEPVYHSKSTWISCAWEGIVKLRFLATDLGIKNIVKYGICELGIKNIVTYVSVICDNRNVETVMYEYGQNCALIPAQETHSKFTNDQSLASLFKSMYIWLK